MEGDFSKPETFTRALIGVDRLFLRIPSSSEVEQQQRNFVDAAKRCNVKHIVKLSPWAADEHAPGRFQRYHGAVENDIRSSHIPYTFLRQNLFLQGLLNFRATISSRGAFYAPAGIAKVRVVDVRDIASIAARALSESGHEGKTYDITGPEALTHAEIAEQLSQALRKSIQFVDVPPGAMRQADGLVEDYDHYRRGETAMVTSTLGDLTGCEPTSFSRFAQDYAGRFLEKAAGAS